MKKEDYLNAIEQITPDEEIKKEIWNNVCFRAGAEKKTFTFRKWSMVAAVLALVCVSFVSASVVAAEIRSLILQRTPAYGILAEAIETSIFSKADEHICVTVEELLTDGVVVEMTVKYTALDKAGKEWLDSFEIGAERGEYKLNIQPHMMNTVEYGVNYSYGAVEQKERATEMERVFLLELQTSGRTYSNNQGIFTFPLTKTTEKVMLDISGNVEIRSFELKGTQTVSEYYTPTYIEISPMSFVIYAKNYGVYERYQDGNYRTEKWLLPDEELDALEENSYFVMKDGSREPLARGAHNATHAKPENMYSDVMLYSERFYTDAQKNMSSPKVMDLDDFDAVVLNGVRFEFVK